jgi:hypothetical protein
VQNQISRRLASRKFSLRSRQFARMESDLLNDNPKLSKDVKNLASNKDFIRAVAEQIKELETV